jgi:outer membrane lipoprotein-sorting protein
MKGLVVASVLGCGLALGPSPVAATELEAAAPGLDARAIARRVEDVFRGETTRLTATMEVTSPRLPAPRRVRFTSWDDRPGRRSFIRILAPPKDEGMAFLKLHPNLWSCIPRVERSIRIPPSMMLQSWMGSDFTNDDLVRDSSQLDDYEHRLLGVDPAPEGADGARAWVVEYVPHEDAPVVWSRILTWVETERAAPLVQEFFDEGGEKLRVMKFSEFRDVDGRPFPHRWSMVPLDKPGHETVIEIEEILFDPEIPASVFTKRNLERRD